MKIEDASQFLQANAVAQRVRQLILGAAPKVETSCRRSTAIALAELRAGKIEVYDPKEAAEILSDDSEELTEEQRAANELARATFEEMFAEPETLDQDSELPDEKPTAGEVSGNEGSPYRSDMPGGD